MANNQRLDGVFLALADPTRRQVITALGSGPASVGTLAQPFDITLPSFMKHIRALEESGLIRTAKSGRVRTCTLNTEGFALVGDWLSAQRLMWEDSTDRLIAVATELEDER